MDIGNNHVVSMPRWSSVVGVARLVIALLVLVFVATTAGLWYSANFAAMGLTLFTVRNSRNSFVASANSYQASATLIIFGYYAISLCRKPEFYNAWVVLGLEIFGVIFWLVSFALCAEWTATFNHRTYFGTGASTDYDSTNFGFWNAPFTPEDIGLESRDIVTGAPAKWKTGVALMGTAAGLGALEL